METFRDETPKRPLDEDDDGDNKKKLKTGPDLHQVLPTVENIKTVNDVKKWNLLPSIVYELLALFKKSEKLNSDDENQDKINHDIKEDLKVLPNQNCQENCLDNAIKYENLKEVNRCDNIIVENSNFQVSNTTKDTIKSLDKSDFSAKYTTEDNPKQIPLFTKASPVKLFAENTDVTKTEQAENESNGKSSTVKKQLTSVENVGHLSVSPINVQCTDVSTNDISKAVMSTEIDYIAATSTNSIYNTPMLTSDISITNTPILISTNSISNTNMFSFTNNNILNVSENSAHKDVISRTENTVRGQLLEFLNISCVNGISGIPLTKPTPCKCNCCTAVNSLPIEQTTVYNLFFSSTNNLSHINLYSDMNSSNLPVADSSIYTTNYSENKSNIPHKFKTLINIDTPKNIWVNQLTSLIIKNENTSKIYLATNTNDSKKLNPMQNILNEIHKDTQYISKIESTSQIYPATKTNDSKKLNPMQSVINKVHKTTQHIKSHFSLCKNCKKSKYSRSDSCKCYSRSYKHKYNRQNYN